MKYDKLFTKKLPMELLLRSRNIAEDLDGYTLSIIANEVIEGYTTDHISRQDWEEKIDDWTRLALQVAETKTFPWPGASNIKYPLITTAALQFSSRAYPAIISGTNIVRGKVVGFDYDGSKTEQAIRVGKHMSYQLMEEMEDWEEEMDRLLFALPILGCMFKKTYFNSNKGTNTSELIYPKDLVVNYYAKNLETAERVTHVLELTANDLYERIEGQIFLDEEYCLSPSDNEDSKKESEEASGVAVQQVDDETTPYKVLEQCRWLDLDGDGYKEPYIVTVDYGSKKVARIVARYDEEGILYNEQGKVIRINPTQYYTKYSFIPSPDGGFYDIGFGIILGPINNTIDTLLNQLVDSGTLANMQSGFISKGIRIKGGNKPFTLGEWKYANTAGDDLRKGIVPLPVREPSQVLFSLLGTMIEAGEKLSSVTETMMGGIPGQNTKATVSVNAIEQGQKVFTSIYKRVYRSLAKECKKLFALNYKYLEPQKYFTILDVGQERAAQIGQRDYDPANIDVVPAADPNIATEQQRMAKVQALMELLQIGTVNPQEVTKRYLEATEQPNVEALMKMPEPQPNPEVEMEKAKMQFEQQKAADESERAWEKLGIERTIAEANALKAIADAEAAEEGNQIGQYQQIMKGMQQDDLAGMKLLQLQEQHQQKIQQQKAQQRQKMMAQQQQGNQKMRQQEEAHRQKMAMQRQQLNQRGTTNGDRNEQGGGAAGNAR